MKPKTPADLLQEEISIMQNKQEIQFLEMRKQFHVVAFNLKPSSLVGNIFQDLVSGAKTNSSIVDNTLGIASGFLTRKFLFGASASPVKRAIGSLVQFGISNLVYKNSLAIKAVGGLVINRIFRKKTTPENEKPLINIT